MSIQAAQEALRAKREAGEIEILDPLEKSARDPESLAAAINAMCWECVGRNNDSGARKEIAACTGWGCPLWPLRPYQQFAPEGWGETKRAEVLSGAKDQPTSTLGASFRHPTSRRKAINAKCFGCMGGTRDLINGCQSMFPREKFGLPTPTGYRGCPLWPHRPGTRAANSD